MRLPEIDFSTHPEVLKFGSWLFDRTGKLYTPDEMAAMDKAYIYDLFAWREGVQFYEDYPNRPDYLK